MEAVIHQSLLERGDQAVDRLATFLAQGEGHARSWNQELLAYLNPVGEFLRDVMSWFEAAQESAPAYNPSWTPLVQSLASFSHSQTSAFILLVEVVRQAVPNLPEATRSLCFDSARNTATAMAQMIHALRSFEAVVERRAKAAPDAAFERVARSRRLQGAAEQGWNDIERGDTLSFDDALARLAQE